MFASNNRQMDDFLFQEMVSREGDGEEFCRIVLSTILGRTVRRVKVVPQKNILGIDTDKHGIRMDAYIEEVAEERSVEGEAVFTTEENVTNQSIAKIHKLVRKVKRDRKAGIHYMKSWERENIARDEGRIESRVEGRIEGRIETLLDILGELGEIPAEVAAQIEQEKNPGILTGWIKLAGQSADIAYFEKNM